MDRPPSKPREEEDGPWVGAFVLLPVLAIAAVIALWGWRWHNSSTVEEALSSAVNRTLAAAPQPQKARRAARPNVADSGPPVAVDGGQPATLTLATLKSMLDASKLLERNAAEAAANVERYCAATGKLPKHLFGDPPDGGPSKDAAYFLDPLVTWEGQPPVQGLLQLPQPLANRIRAARDDWPNALSIGDTAGLDFGWMPQLLGYDHWSLASAGAFAEQGPTVDPFNASTPSYWQLTDYAKLRYVRALAQGDIAEAIAEVQQLADLVESNGLTIAEMAAGQMVSLEAPFLAAAAQRGYAIPDAATAALDAAGYAQFRDLTYAGAAFTMPGVDDAVFKRAMECVPDPCVAINDGVAIHRELDRLSQRGDDDPFWAYADSHACDPALLKLLKSAPSAGLGPLGGWLSGQPLPLEQLFGPGVAAPAGR